jgi:hypothetical protein
VIKSLHQMMNEVFDDQISETYSEVFERCWSEVDELAIECLTQDNIQGRNTIVAICLIINENNHFFVCSYLAKAFLDTLDPEFAYGELDEEKFRRASMQTIAAWYEGEMFKQITLLQLIEQFYGESYMHDHYAILNFSDDILSDNNDGSTCVPDENEWVEEVESDDELSMPAFR